MASPSKRITLDDLSSHLNLSKYSVSRALSGRGGVSERTRALVFDAARELRYDHPSLSGQPAASKGDLILLIPRDDAVSSQYWLEVITGADEEARKAGHTLVTHLIGGGIEPPPHFQDAGGLVIAGRRSRGVLEPYLGTGLPTMLIGYPKPFEAIDSVHPSSWDGGYAAGRHLAGFGHRRVAFLTDVPEDMSRLELLRGLRQGMAEVDGAVVTSHPCLPGASGKDVVRAALADGALPTAFFATTDTVAMTIAWALSEAGLKVPEHVSLVSCSDSDSATRLGLQLTTIRHPMREIGAAAIRMLHWRLAEAESGAAPRQLSLRSRFIERASTGPADGEALARAIRAAGVG